MSDVAPVKVGFLADYVEGEDKVDPVVVRTLQLVFDEFHASGKLERPVEVVVRAVQGLPNGSFRAVRNAFYELVEEDCVVIFGPYVSENGVPLSATSTSWPRSRASRWPRPRACWASGSSR